MDVSLEIFRKSRAAFDPITAVEVFEPVDRPDLRPVDVSADHPFDPRLPGHPHHRLLVLGHVANRALGLEFEVGGHRPVTESQTSPKAIQVEVDSRIQS